MRLTHKHKYKRSSQRFVFDMKDYRKACQKLGQLEDAEELCKKIVSQPVYEKDLLTGHIYKRSYKGYHALYDFETESIDIYCLAFEESYCLKSYKKTWAFSKKELE